MTINNRRVSSSPGSGLPGSGRPGSPLAAFLPQSVNSADQEAWRAHCLQLTVTWFPLLGLGVAAMAVLWWPLDWVFYEPGSQARRSLGWMRGILIVVDPAMALLLPLLKRHYDKALMVAVAAVSLNLGVAGWALGGMDDGGVLGITYSFVAPLFSMLLLLPLGKRVAANLLFYGAIVLGWALHPVSVFGASGVVSSLSYLGFAYVLATFLGHALFASIRHSFQLGLAVERQRAELAELATGLEEEVEGQTRSIRELHAAARKDRSAQRQQVAREMHDGLGQELLSLRLLVGVGRQLHPEAEVQQTLVEMDGQVERLQLSLRQVLVSLRPSLEGGLAEALSALVADLERRSGLSIKLEVGLLPRSLDGEHASAVYRVAQEGLVNALRHARAKSVVVRLFQRSGDLHLVVHDDGVGISPAQVGSGLGTLGIQERAQDMGARVTWSSEGGTRLSFALPLKETP